MHPAIVEQAVRHTRKHAPDMPLETVLARTIGELVIVLRHLCSALPVTAAVQPRVTLLEAYGTEFARRGEQREKGE